MPLRFPESGQLVYNAPGQAQASWLFRRPPARMAGWVQGFSVTTALPRVSRGLSRRLCVLLVAQGPVGGGI